MLALSYFSQEKFIIYGTFESNIYFYKWMLKNHTIS